MNSINFEIRSRDKDVIEKDIKNLVDVLDDIGSEFSIDDTEKVGDKYYACFDMSSDRDVDWNVVEETIRHVAESEVSDFIHYSEVPSSRMTFELSEEERIRYASTVAKLIQYVIENGDSKDCVRELIYGKKLLEKLGGISQAKTVQKKMNEVFS